MIESSSAISLSSPLNKKQAKRLLAVDKKCREHRSIEMKKRNKVTQEILRKSVRGRTLNSNLRTTNSTTDDKNTTDNKNTINNDNRKPGGGG